MRCALVVRRRVLNVLAVLVLFVVAFELGATIRNGRSTRSGIRLSAIWPMRPITPLSPRDSPCELEIAYWEQFLEWITGGESESETWQEVLAAHIRSIDESTSESRRRLKR